LVDAALIVRRSRTISGCILFFYVFTHLLNHSLGLISLDTMEQGRAIFLRFWRHDVLFYVLYGALSIHFLLGVYALARRRSFRMSRKEWIRNSCAVLIPFFLASHLSITLWGSRFLGLNDSYAFMIISTYIFDPFGYIILGLMLMLVWTHGSIGIIGLIEFREFYSKRRGLFQGLILGLPLIAYGGYIRASIELSEASQSNPITILELISNSNFTAEIGEKIVSLSDLLQFLVYPILLSLFVAFYFIRNLLEKRFNSIQVQYTDGTNINVSRGSSLLEASHKAGRYHESVCGGRGRCTTCRVRVTSSLGELPKPNKIEQSVINRLNFDQSLRLACQLRPETDIEINPLIKLVNHDKQNLRFSNQENLSGIEKETVIMFCDLRGFTRLSDGKMPFDVVFILNKYFKLVTDAVEENKGRIDKFIGDGVMAIFDKDTTISKNCKNALKGAAMITTYLNELNDELSTDDIEPLRLGIGIHSGNAIIGKMGYGEASTDTAIGDTVNVASRLEQLTKDYSCQLMFSSIVAENAELDKTKLNSVKTKIRGKKDYLEAFYCGSADEAIKAL
jgi:adenylate cyclase